MREPFTGNINFGTKVGFLAWIHGFQPRKQVRPDNVRVCVDEDVPIHIWLHGPDLL